MRDVAGMLTLVTAIAIEGDELAVTLDRGERWWGLLRTSGCR